MASQQMPGVVPRDLVPADFEDPNLQRVNEYFRELATMANIHAGAHGPIPLTVDMNMQNNDITNVKATTIAELTVNGSAPAVGAGALGLGSGTAPAATAGSAALPAAPAGFLVFSLGGKQIKLAFYNP